MWYIMYYKHWSCVMQNELLFSEIGDGNAGHIVDWSVNPFKVCISLKSIIWRTRIEPVGKPDREVAPLSEFKCLECVYTKMICKMLSKTVCK